jgi:lipopolysaccharide export system permease protein
MKILSRYVLRQHALPFVFAFTAITSFELLRQIARRLEALLGKGLPWTVIAEFFALTIPFLVAITLSMSVLVAVLYTVSRMAGDQEITALRAGGVSLGQMVRPILAGALVVAVASFLFGDQILPRTNHRLSNLLRDIYRTKPTFALKEHTVNEVEKGRTALRAAQIDAATYRMLDVTLYSLDDPSRTRIVYADTGWLAFAPNQEDLRLTLDHGAIHEFDRDDPHLLQRTGFARQIIMIRGIGSEFVRREGSDFRGDRELSVCELDSVVRMERSAVRREGVLADVAERNALLSLVGLPPVGPDPTPPARAPSLYCRALAAIGHWVRPEPLEAQEAAGRQGPSRRPPQWREGESRPAPGAQDTLLTNRMNRPAREAFRTGVAPRGRAADVRIARDRERQARVRAENYAVELHKKYSIPASCIVFVLIGVPLGFRFPRSGLGLVLGAGMSVFGMYYVGLIAGETLANRLIVPAWIAMWIANLLMAVVGVWALWRTHRAGCARRVTSPYRPTGGEERRREE